MINTALKCVFNNRYLHFIYLYGLTLYVREIRMIDIEHYAVSNILINEQGARARYKI